MCFDVTCYTSRRRCRCILHRHCLNRGGFPWKTGIYLFREGSTNRVPVHENTSEDCLLYWIHGFWVKYIITNIWHSVLLERNSSISINQALTWGQSALGDRFLRRNHTLFRSRDRPQQTGLSCSCQLCSWSPLWAAVWFPRPFEHETLGQQYFYPNLRLLRSPSLLSHCHRFTPSAATSCNTRIGWITGCG